MSVRMDWQELQDERQELLEHVDAILDPPLIVLSFAWLALLILDFTRGLSHTLNIAVYIIWALFIFDFVLEITIAPNKVRYLRDHWLTAISLAVPALRVFRVVESLRALQAARAAREIGLVRTIGAMNRGLRTLRSTFAGQALAFVVALTVLVTFGGAAGMYYLERPNPGFETYGDAVWWTAMAITTMGSEQWPRTFEGRILGWLIAVYAFAMFGYITATIATWLIGSPRAAPAGEEAASEPAPGRAADGNVATEIAALRGEIRRLEALLTDR